jgi:PhnB protein
MMEISPYLLFNGNCADAFKFYEKSLGGTITFIQKFGESPMADQVPADWRDKIMHVTMKVGDGVLMGTDASPAHYAAPQGVSVSIAPATTEEGERMFNALADQGKVGMPFQKTFWSPGFGMTVDRFGISWIVNCEGTP